MKRFAAVLILAAAAAAPAQDPPRRGTVAAQAAIGENACGPCAVYNALQFGERDLAALAGRLPGKSAEEQIRGLIARHGGRPSEEYGDGRPRYSEKEGMGWADVLGLANDALKDGGFKPLEGGYLDRRQGEEPADHVRRVHRALKASLDAGQPPLVSFRSFMAKQNGAEFLWEGLFGHWVAVVEVQDSLAGHERGFRFGFADSWSGRVEHGYVHAEEARNFTAAKGNLKKWEWVTDRPFLLVTAPALRLKTQDAPWFARTFITLNYAVVRP